MNLTVKVPGSCGELIQGSIGGKPFLVTCPIDRFAKAGIGGGYFSYLPYKTRLARSRTLEYLRVKSYEKIYLMTQLLTGKGMASSSADIAAVCQLTALSCGRKLSEQEIAFIAAGIEPTDGIFCEGIVRYCHLTGRVEERFETPPAIKLLMLDLGGRVDTLNFNRRQDLKRLYRENEDEIHRALRLLRRGFAQGDINCIGQAAAASAYANQRILHKHCLEDIMVISEKYNAVGVNAAHSGTIVGVLFARTADQRSVDECCREILSTCPGLRSLGTANMISGGIRIIDKGEYANAEI